MSKFLNTIINYLCLKSIFYLTIFRIIGDNVWTKFQTIQQAYALLQGKCYYL